MPIPLYFAVNWKESVNNPKILLAQNGYGLQPDGRARLPERHLSAALRIIDDAILPTNGMTADAVEVLAAHCSDGFYLDFERPSSAAQIALLLGLRERLSSQRFALPERYLRIAPEALPVVACPRPCNCWEHFVQSAQRRHPSGWMLEIIPWDMRIAVQQGASFDAVELRAARCFCQSDGTLLHYYDTQESISSKLTAAEAFGCRAAIGIRSELVMLGFA